MVVFLIWKVVMNLCVELKGILVMCGYLLVSFVKSILFLSVSVSNVFLVGLLISLLLLIWELVYSMVGINRGVKLGME